MTRDEAIKAMRDEGRKCAHPVWDASKIMWSDTQQCLCFDDGAYFEEYAYLESACYDNDWQLVPQKVKKTVWVNLWLAGKEIECGVCCSDESEANRIAGCPVGVAGYLGARPITVEVDE